MPMLRHRQSCANAGQWPWKVGAVIADQLIGVGRVLRLVAIAGDDQVVGQRPHQAMQVRDQRLPVPVQQTLVEAAHALATAAGQQKDRAGQWGRMAWHDGSCGQ